MHVLILFLSILGLIVLACGSLLQLSQAWVEDGPHDAPTAPIPEADGYREVSKESPARVGGGMS